MRGHFGDWTIWRVLEDNAQLADEIKSELDGILASSLDVVNQTAHVFARLLASYATVRREGILDSSGGHCAELVQRATENTQKSLLLFKVAVGHAGKPKGGNVTRF